MNLGFETCGNATLIAYDAGIPVLTTDPWLHGAQYFGSWTLPCAVLNLNDGSAIGNRLKLKAHLKSFARRFVLKLLGGGRR
jgi:hypothetical protein